MKLTTITVPCTTPKCSAQRSEEKKLCQYRRPLTRRSAQESNTNVSTFFCFFSRIRIWTVVGRASPRQLDALPLPPPVYGGRMTARLRGPSTADVAGHPPPGAGSGRIQSENRLTRYTRIIVYTSAYEHAVGRIFFFFYLYFCLDPRRTEIAYQRRCI